MKGIKFQLTALFVALFGFILIVFSGFLYNVFTSNQQQEFDAMLFNHTLDIAGSLKMDIFGGAFLSSEYNLEREKVLPFNIGKTFIIIRDRRGKIISRSTNTSGLEFPFDLAQIIEDVQNLGSHYDTTTLDADRDTKTAINVYRIVTMPVDNPGMPPFFIQVAAPMDLIMRERNNLLTFLSLAIPVVLVVAWFVGYFFAKKALHPVEIITQKAQDISIGNLSDRIPVPANQDEIHDLAKTLNHLLQRLESSFKSQEQFVADASHQLKTPLAIMKGEIDLLRRKKASQEELVDFLESASQEVTAMSKITSNLLLLARASAQHEEFIKSKVRLDEILVSQVASIEKLAQSKGIKIRVNLDPDSSSHFDVRGNEELLGCLFQNLVENAVKYSPNNSTIDVSAQTQNKDIVVSIQDEGPGVSTHDMTKIFEPFYRSENTAFSTDGAGLGLSLAQKIAEVHDAKLYAVNRADRRGAEFRLEIKYF